MSEYCPVREGPCTHHLCAVRPGCEQAADAVLALEPDQYDAAIQEWAGKLDLDPQLLEEFIYGKAFGPDASIFIDPDSPFSDI